MSWQESGGEERGWGERGWGEEERVKRKKRNESFLNRDRRRPWADESGGTGKGAQMGGSTQRCRSAKGERSVCEIDPAFPPPPAHIKHEAYVTVFTTHRFVFGLSRETGAVVATWTELFTCWSRWAACWTLWHLQVSWTRAQFSRVPPPSVTVVFDVWHAEWDPRYVTVSNPTHSTFTASCQHWNYQLYLYTTSTSMATFTEGYCVDHAVYYL